MVSRFIRRLGGALVSAWLGTAAAADQGYLAEALAQAEAADLAGQRAWRTLLHYRRAADGVSWLSDAADPRFFLAPDGQINPQAELAATLRALFTTQPVGVDRQPAQCAFVARYQWLKTVLALDAYRLPPQACPAFRQWFDALNVAGVSLVFASAYFNNPASLFGHLFLRLDQPDPVAGADLLAYVVNYAADTTGHPTLWYAVNGLTGQFQGRFQVQPYYQMVRTYGDLESRDLWEYRLNLNAGQRRRLLEHLWELREIRFDYYFLRENCAWQLLTLLEAAEPDWRLSRHFAVWAAPAEVIRLLYRQPGLLGAVTARPGRGSAVRRRYAALTAPERRLVRRLLADATIAATSAFRRLPPERQALLLELALDERRRRQSGALPPGQELPPDRIGHRLLTARRRLPVAATPVAITPYATGPEIGHASRRIGLAGGRRDGTGFAEIAFRAGYHGLLEPDAGYTPDGGIEIFNLALRRTARNGGLALERLTLLDILSLPPLTALNRQPSWRVQVGWEPEPLIAPHRPIFTVGGSLGWTLALDGPGRPRWLVLPGVTAQIGDELPSGYRAGWVVETGLLLQPASAWQVLASATWLDYRLGEKDATRRLALRQQWQLTRNWALIWDGWDWGGVQEFRLGLQTYF